MNEKRALEDIGTSTSAKRRSASQPISQYIKESFQDFKNLISTSEVTISPIDFQDLGDSAQERCNSIQDAIKKIGISESSEELKFKACTLSFLEKDVPSIFWGLPFIYDISCMSNEKGFHLFVSNLLQSVLQVVIPNLTDVKFEKDQELEFAFENIKSKPDFLIFKDNKSGPPLVTIECKYLLSISLFESYECFLEDWKKNKSKAEFLLTNPVLS
ncbi:hypothetical protein DASC09_055600 [Saccharomycopsis crataegensis]|uniref:Uncharacterized protein n=1 Tax=Saccharomycopsis crataegensis TaxID=43959 RepID=A0AAV5QUK8_9ASCO|nr:hypothetical protein DASC09_055600 [Saccharomycopsis crataegensis]